MSLVCSFVNNFFYLHQGTNFLLPLPPRASLRVGLSLHRRRNLINVDLSRINRGVLTTLGKPVALVCVLLTAGVTAVAILAPSILIFGALIFLLIAPVAIRRIFVSLILFRTALFVLLGFFLFLAMFPAP